MANDQAEQAALIVVCPEAEAAVGAHRLRLDRAARFGVPAHVTVVFPFRPVAAMAREDHATLERVLGGFAPFTIRGERTEWFGESVVYVALEDPEPVVRLTEAVIAAFPEFPPYGGAFDEVVPHLTIGHDHPRAELAAAAGDVAGRLPFDHVVGKVELWSGPVLTGAVGRGWRRVRDYRLG